MAPAKRKTVKSKAVKKTGGKKPATKAGKIAPPKKPKSKKPAIKTKLALKSAPKPARAARPAGVPEQMRDAALKILNNRQAEDIITVDLSGRSSIADYLIIASGRAARQLAAIAHYLGEAFAQLGSVRTRVEGLPEANWVLVDGGDVLVHLFLPEVRRYYDLEKIWDRKNPE